MTLANWQDPPFNRWGFQHIRDLIPTARIARERPGVARCPRADRDLDALAVPLGPPPPYGGTMLADTATDGFLVLHRGRIVTEQYFNGLHADTHAPVDVRLEVHHVHGGRRSSWGGDGWTRRAGRPLPARARAAAASRAHRAAPAGHAHRHAVQRGLRGPGTPRSASTSSCTCGARGIVGPARSTPAAISPRSRTTASTAGRSATGRPHRRARVGDGARRAARGCRS